MPKNTTKILGALAGAVLAPVVVIAGVLLLYRPRGSENWDMGTPMLTMAALLPAAFLGAVVGYVTVDLVRAGDRKAVGWLGGSGALLIVLIPVGIVALPFLLSLLPSRPPSVEETRAEWARRIGSTPVGLGAELANRLQGCVRDGIPASGEAVIANGCPDVGPRWIGAGAARIAKLGVYTDADDGWRWDIVDSAGGRRLTVFPDPLLAQAGPTFEVRPGQKPFDPRSSRAPGSDSTLARLAGFRRCLRDWGLELRGSRTWASVADSIPRRVQADGPFGGRCPGARVEGVAAGPHHPWTLSWRNGAGRELRVFYRPVYSDTADAPFEMSLTYDRSGYLLDTQGRWHTRQGGYALTMDPAPPVCMVDPAVRCE